MEFVLSLAFENIVKTPWDRNSKLERRAGHVLPITKHRLGRPGRRTN